jgi:Ca-activated chloride channel homolog
VAAHLLAGGVNRVLLLTDGQANAGITDPTQLTGLCHTARAAGVSTTTIGFGVGYNEDLLRAMADAGGGSTYYIERPDQAPGVFAEELEGLLSIAAQNVGVRVEAAPGVQFIAVRHSYPAHTDGEARVVEVGDLYAREPRLLLAEFLLPPGADGDDVPVARLEVTGDVLTSEGAIERRTIALPVTLSPVAGGRVDPEVRRELLLLETATARTEALRAHARGDFGGTADMLREAAFRLSVSGLDDVQVSEEAADLAALAEQATSCGLSEMEVKYMTQRSYDSSRSKRAASERISRTRPKEERKGGGEGTEV